PLPVPVERIAVLHDKLPGAHDAEARADLVAVLVLNLVDDERELPVRADLRTDHVGDDLLVGRPEAELPAVAVLQAEHLLAVIEPAPAFVPQLRRLDEDRKST